MLYIKELGQFLHFKTHNSAILGLHFKVRSVYLLTQLRLGESLLKIGEDLVFCAALLLCPFIAALPVAI